MLFLPKFVHGLYTGFLNVGKLAKNTRLTAFLGNRVSKQQKAAWRPVKMLRWLLLFFISVTYSVSLSKSVATNLERCSNAPPTETDRICRQRSKSQWHVVPVYLHANVRNVNVCHSIAPEKGWKISTSTRVLSFHQCRSELKPINTCDHRYLQAELFVLGMNVLAFQKPKAKCYWVLVGFLSSGKGALFGIHFINLSDLKKKTNSFLKTANTGGVSKMVCQCNNVVNKRL